MNRNVRRHTFWRAYPTKTHISLRRRAVWSVFLSAWRKFVSLASLNAPSEISVQTARMHMSKGTFSDVAGQIESIVGTAELVTVGVNKLRNVMKLN